MKEKKNKQKTRITLILPFRNTDFSYFSQCNRTLPSWVYHANERREDDASMAYHRIMLRERRVRKKKRFEPQKKPNYRLCCACCVSLLDFFFSLHLSPLFSKVRTPEYLEEFFFFHFFFFLVHEFEESSKKKKFASQFESSSRAL